MPKSGPNILITGTPGTGKSTLAEEVASRSGLHHLNVGSLASEQELFESWDEKSLCHVLDEDRVVDEMEPHMASGGQVVDYHACDFFPERWFDVVFVLRTDNSRLHARLTARNYPAKKIQDNIHCEIVQVILDEARECYPPDIVHELPSNIPDDLENNADQICAWIANWKRDNGLE